MKTKWLACYIYDDGKSPMNFGSVDVHSASENKHLTFSEIRGLEKEIMEKFGFKQIVIMNLIELESEEYELQE